MPQFCGVSPHGDLSRQTQPESDGELHNLTGRKPRIGHGANSSIELLLENYDS
jgi:hypothetical protein